MDTGSVKSVITSDPEGISWRVEVRWLPWSPRWRGVTPGRKKKDERDPRWYDWLDWGDPLAFFDDGLGGFVTALTVVVLIVVAILFVLPAFLFVVELVIVALVVILGVMLRVLFRRPWLIDAFPVQDRARHLTWKVVGLAESKRAVEQIARQLAAGVEIPNVPAAELVKHPSST